MNKKAKTIFTSLILLMMLFACDDETRIFHVTDRSDPVAIVDDDPIDDGTDTDADGLSDLSETTGWTITISQANGEFLRTTVTSDPENPDTDNDGVSDWFEKSALSDPRKSDTDDDQLSDWQELNEIYSSPYTQDTDGDGLLDGVEFEFHLTSPISVDTDGDQLGDYEEIVLATRNARVADLPAPTIEVGEINLQLDVRFTETTSAQTRELESRSTNSTLTQSNRQEYANTNSNTQQAMAKLSLGTSYKVKGNIFGPGGEFNTNVGFETSWTGSWTSSHTDTSTQETQQAYMESLSTDEEVTEGATVERHVEGASMQVTVTIENASGLAYSVRNIQVSAFIQDPQDPTVLKPVATLLPDSEPAEGFHLGPLVPARGPFIFSNDLIVPQLVEDLMKNPRGLVFAISNYDISDELGRNFAFSSQEVAERTAALVIDFGSYDSDGDNEGDLTEYHRIATSAGRHMGAAEHRIVFDEDGAQVGITLRDALRAIGLSHYTEGDTPTSSLTDDELDNSYSTIIDDAGVERIFRVRRAATESGIPKAWEVLTPTGIDQTISLDEFILKTEDDIKLSFVQDVDEDRLVASLEFTHSCSDVFADTDGDGLDDREEILIGWQIQTSRGSRQVYSRCADIDTDADGLTDAEESGMAIDCDADGSTDATWKTDPGRADTDEDGIADRDEICGYPVTLRGTTETITITTDPTNADTDGDTAPDGLEADLGGNPTDPSDIDQFADADGDGLVNIQETEGWLVKTYGVSDQAGICLSQCAQGALVESIETSDPFKSDTDGDGLPDGVEKSLGTNADDRDTDGDGIDDNLEVNGFTLRDLGIITLDPNDADTDNDKRSDGQEAQLENRLEDRWIIRPLNSDPYQVHSNPLLADADFDTLVDGEEFAAGSDPTVANTDGDRRDDATEIALGLNPLMADYRITVSFRSLTIEQRGDTNTNLITGALCLITPSLCGDGEIVFEFNVRKPDSSTPTGLAAMPTRVASDSDFWSHVAPCNAPSLVDLWSHNNTPCKAASDNAIEMQNGDTINFFDTFYPASESKYTVTFTLAENQRFSIEGRIGEADAHPSLNYHWVNFGGLDGLLADHNGTELRTVLDGVDLDSHTVEHLSFNFTHPNWNDPIGGGWVSPGKGELIVLYVVE